VSTPSDDSSWSVTAAHVIIDQLISLGVVDIVACPGSRSAPLVLAAARADQRGQLRLLMRLDERGAAFLALGIAKAKQSPVAIITSSGTAVANLAPALAEARFAGLPLLVISADRPATLIGTGASQTADQIGMLGNLPLAVWRIAAADQAPSAWQATVQRAVLGASAALGGTPGPVQINCELQPPLVGQSHPWSSRSLIPVSPLAEPVAEVLPADRRTVIVAGDLPVAQGRALSLEAARAGVPLLAEPSSNARFGPAAISAYRYLLPALAGGIERVLVYGHPTLSRPVTNLIQRRDIELIVVPQGSRWVDPGWAVDRIATRVSLAKTDGRWLRRWTRADRQFRAGLARLDRDWSGIDVAALVWEATAGGQPLFLGASNPIRDADLAPVTDGSPQVFANRGLAGIDGIIASASGLALGMARPVTALIGDLTAIHDLGSLVQPRIGPRIDLKLVVANDQGGSLFHSLEYGDPGVLADAPDDAFERLFATPQTVDLVAVARACGARSTVVTDGRELRSALRLPDPGLHLIDIHLGRHDRRRLELACQALGHQSVDEVSMGHGDCGSLAQSAA
jgi:2-succinyl-5-enolpyruvyl-6-hydroxy-3-cyclohexene-1-carboxylate synthase